MKKLFTWIMAILCVVVCAGSVMVLVANEEKNKENQDAQATAAFEDIEARLSALEQSNVSGTLDDYGNRIDALEQSGTNAVLEKYDERLSTLEQSNVSETLDDYGDRIDALESSANSERIVGIIADGEVDPSLTGGITFTFKQEDFEKFAGKVVKVTVSVVAKISTKEGDFEYRQSIRTGVGSVASAGSGSHLILAADGLCDTGTYGYIPRSSMPGSVHLFEFWIPGIGEEIQGNLVAYATIELF